MTNDERAERAARALLAYAGDDYWGGESTEAVMQDLICDMRHLLDRAHLAPLRDGSDGTGGYIGPVDDSGFAETLRERWDQMLSMALRLYEEEVAEEEDEDGEES